MTLMFLTVHKDWNSTEMFGITLNYRAPQFKIKLNSYMTSVMMRNTSVQVGIDAKLSQSALEFF